MSDILISYARENSEFCDRLFKGLNELYDVWIDRSDIAGGAKWVKAIEDGIKSSEVILIVISKEANDSDWVRRETAYALQSNRYIIPLLLSDQLPISLIDLQYIDFQGTFEGGFRDLLEILSKKIKPGDQNKNDAKCYLGDGILQYLSGNVDEANLLITKALTTSPDLNYNANEFWKELSDRLAIKSGSDSLAQKYQAQIKISEITKRVGKYKDGSDMYEWTVRLNVAAEILRNVEYVKYLLHETFREPVQIVRNRDQNFSLTRRGWGVFTIKVEVFFIDGSSAKTEYDLTFR